MFKRREEYDFSFKFLHLNELIIVLVLLVLYCAKRKVPIRMFFLNMFEYSQITFCMVTG